MNTIIKEFQKNLNKYKPLYTKKIQSTVWQKKPSNINEQNTQCGFIVEYENWLTKPKFIGNKCVYSYKNFLWQIPHFC